MLIYLGHGNHTSENVEQSAELGSSFPIRKLISRVLSLLLSSQEFPLPSLLSTEKFVSFLSTNKSKRIKVAQSLEQDCATCSPRGSFVRPAETCKLRNKKLLLEIEVKFKPFQLSESRGFSSNSLVSSQ